MKEIKNMLLSQYQVRKSDAQKDAFIAYATKFAKGLGFSVKVEESGRFPRTRNIVIGDVDKANTLITAHFDTCVRMPFPNVLTPKCWPLIIVTQFLLPVLLFTALGYFCGYSAGSALKDVMSPLMAGVAGLALYAAIFAAVMGLMLFGPANPHTANDNTSGVTAVLALMRRMAGREDVAFVLFDNEEMGLLGSKAFVKAHPAAAKRVTVVNFDCVSDGRTLLYAGSKKGMATPKAKKIAKALQAAAPKYDMRAQTGITPKTFYPSDQMSFPNGTALAAFKGDKVLYINRIHTAKDTVFEDRNLLCLMEAVEMALEPAAE